MHACPSAYMQSCMHVCLNACPACECINTLQHGGLHAYLSGRSVGSPFTNPHVCMSGCRCVCPSVSVVVGRVVAGRLTQVMARWRTGWMNALGWKCLSGLDFVD